MGERISFVGGYWEGLVGDEGRGLVYEPAVLGRLVVGILEFVGATGVWFVGGMVLVLVMGTGAVGGMVLDLVIAGWLGVPLA